MKTKTTLYLSIIISAYIVGKVFNPIPFSNYAFYVLVTALFVPYFGKFNTAKILLTLSSISLVNDIPFFVSMMQQWPVVVQTIETLIVDNMPKTAVSTQAVFATHSYGFYPWLTYLVSPQTMFDMYVVMGDPLFLFGFLITGIYVSLLGGFAALTSAYEKSGVYRRITF